MAGGLLRRANPRRQRRPAHRGSRFSSAKDRAVSGPGTSLGPAQFLLQRDQGILLHEKRDLGQVSARNQGQEASQGRPGGHIQAEEIFRRTQPEVLRIGGGGSGLARRVTTGVLDHFTYQNGVYVDQSELEINSH